MSRSLSSDGKHRFERKRCVPDTCQAIGDFAERLSTLAERLSTLAEPGRPE